MAEMYIANSSIADAIHEIRYDATDDSVTINLSRDGSIAFCPYISISLDMLAEILDTMPQEAQDSLAKIAHKQRSYQERMTEKVIASKITQKGDTTA